MVCTGKGGAGGTDRVPEQQEGGDGAAPACTCTPLPCVPGREPARTLLSNIPKRGKPEMCGS